VLYVPTQVVGVISGELGSYTYTGKSGRHGRAVFYALEVTELLEHWPESAKRKRKLVSAIAACCETTKHLQTTDLILVYFLLKH
jgi:hypothetical protein